MSPFSRLVARNWTLKLSALGLALLLWVSVRVESPDRHDLPGVPVRVELSDPEWVVAGDPLPTTVAVRFAGPARELIRMAMDRPNLVIPVGQVHGGDTTVVLQSQWVRIQDRPGVVVEDIQPSSIRLTFEAMERATLPLVVRTTGTLPDELALAGPPIVEPSEVRVGGRASRLAPLDSIPLQVLDLGGVTSPDPRMVPLDTTGLGGLTFSPTSATVSFRVEDRIERIISGIPVGSGGGGWEGDYLASPSTVTASLSGARSLVERVDAASLFVVADFTPPETVANDDDEASDEPREFRVPISFPGLPQGVSGSLIPDSVVLRPVGDG